MVGRNCTYATETSMPLPIVQPPFSCELNFISSSMDITASDIFFAASGFDIDKGMYFCSIETVNKISMSETSILEGQLSLTVHLLSVDHSSSLSQQLLLSFLPAFYVQQDEVLLSDLQPTNHIIISATPPVQRCILVVPSDPTVLKVKSPVLNPNFPASISFPVEVIDINNLWRTDIASLHIDISCPVTKQQVKLPVRVKKLDMPLDISSYCPPQPAPVPSITDSFYDWYFLLKTSTALLVIVITIYVVKWVKTARRGIVTSQPVFLNTSSSSSHNFSPDCSRFSSPYLERQYSPRSLPEDFENLSQPLRLCSLDTSPKTLQRRRSDNIFR
ncbi:Nuclear pore membrane glycoprotein 210-like protein, partial [Stegodyphus mimosarum]